MVYDLTNIQGNKTNMTWQYFMYQREKLIKISVPRM